jgi:hypothetical protein
MTTLRKKPRPVKRSPCQIVCQRCGLGKPLAGAIEFSYRENHRTRKAQASLCLRCKAAVGGAAA